MRLIQLLVLVSVLGLSGCQIWTHIKKPKNEVVYKKVGVELPTDWVKFNPADFLLLTKDGTSVQAISVRKFDHENAFDAIEKSSSSEMGAAELAELFITNFKKTNEDVTVNVKSMKPFSFQNEVQGFEVELEMLTQKGLTRVIKVNGAAMDYGLVLFSLDAPKLHYFDRDVKSYDEFVKSATL